MVPRTQTPAPDIKSASICKPMAGRVLWGFVFFLCLCHVTTLGMVRKRHPSTATTIKPTHADTDDVQSRDGCCVDTGTPPSASQELSSVLFVLPLRPSRANHTSFLLTGTPSALPSAPPRLATPKEGHWGLPGQGQACGLPVWAALTAFLDTQKWLVQGKLGQLKGAWTF